MKILKVCCYGFAGLLVGTLAGSCAAGLLRSSVPDASDAIATATSLVILASCTIGAVLFATGFIEGLFDGDRTPEGCQGIAMEILRLRGVYEYKDELVEIRRNGGVKVFYAGELVLDGGFISEPETSEYHASSDAYVSFRKRGPWIKHCVRLLRKFDEEHKVSSAKLTRERAKQRKRDLDL